MNVNKTYWLFGFLLAMFGLLGLIWSMLVFGAAYSEAYLYHQCPDGNNCEDSVAVMRFISIFAVVSALIIFAGLLHIWKAKKAKH